MSRKAVAKAKPSARKATRQIAKAAAVSRKGSGPTKTDEVNTFMKELDHPLKKDIEAVRKTILGVDPEIREGIKWNAPSYRLDDYFATFHLRAPDKVQLVFHRGAKAKKDGKKLITTDPHGLIKWLSDDRCLVTLGAGTEVKANLPALKNIVAAWISQI